MTTCKIEIVPSTRRAAGLSWAQQIVARARALVSGALLATAGLLSTAATGATLPVPCGVGTCGNAGPLTFVTSGAATTNTNAAGNTLTINQTTDKAVLNWSSFNIDADGHVIFVQPAASSIALNRIFQESPSRIFGQLTANGQVYLVNPNGMIFGASAKVSAAGILASTLNISDDVFNNGLLSALTKSNPALASDGRLSVVDASGLPVLGSDGQPLKVELVVQHGAELSTTAANGRVLLAGQSVSNAGSISTPDGQIILAAGDKVYLQASTDPALRGLLVEVDVGGTASNDLAGQLQAARGDITMVGLAVNQNGRVSATTTVAANGSVRLLARDGATVSFDDISGQKTGSVSATKGGTLILGAGSVTEVLPELADTAKAVDDQKQLASTVELTGQQITLTGGSRLTAPGGALSVTAATDLKVRANDPLSKIRVESGATIDLSGSNALLPVSANVVTVELRANELANSPNQRNGALRGKTVTFDARVGTPIADVSGAIAAIPKNIAQRTSAGGSATFSSGGSVVVASGATINVSGGQTTFTGGQVYTSQLIGADGQLVDIGSASESANYVGVLNPTAKVIHDTWGVVQSIPGQSVGHYEAGYVAGSSAGKVVFQAPGLSLQGQFLGNAINGPYQRDPTSSLNYAQGGQFVIGTDVPVGSDYRAPDVTLLNGPVPVTLVDPISTMALPLSMSQLSAGGFNNFEIYSNGTITLPKSTPLQLADGSKLLLRANRVDILSDITDLGGRIDAASTTTINTATAAQRSGVALGADTTLDVSGTWINDTELSDPSRPTRTLFQNGGSISLAASNLNNALQIGDNVHLLADGGAWLNRASVLTGGKGGDIKLLADGQSSALALGNNTYLEAFGVNGSAGGSFALSAGRLLVAPGAPWAIGQSYDPLTAQFTQPVQLGDSLFSDFGFSQVSLTATGGTAAAQGDALQVAAGADVDAFAATLLLDPQAGLNASGGSIDGFSVPTLLPVFQTNPTSINLAVKPYAGYVGGRVGDLHIASGARVTADPRSSVTLETVDGSIQIDGSIVAHGGRVSATISPTTGDSNPQPYDADLRLRVGSTGRVDVSGTTIFKPNDSALLQGSMLAGGSISLTAKTGAVVIESGAVLNASGSSAALDVPTGQPTAPFARQQVASSAGSISLLASESIDIGGRLTAIAGVGDSGHAAGGTLSIELTRDSAQVPTSSPDLAQTYPTALRTVELSNAVAGPAANGQAVLTTGQISAGGFDSLRLAAQNQVLLDAGVDLTLGRRLAIDAPVIGVQGIGATSVSAPFMMLGNSNTQANSAVASTGTGTLSANAGFIDLVGNTVLQNVKRADLSSSGDMELRGVFSPAGISGSLALAGDLSLSAARIYPSTATQFTLSDPGKTVNIAQSGVSGGVPLSAAGKITIAASTINQAGTLLAPFGDIELNASSALTLAKGSLTSVSGAGAVIPYGQTVNGKDWVYSAVGGNNQTIKGVPARQVNLSGNAVSIDQGATVDMSGGGDLYAYEWIKGSGGTRDALAASVSGQYAILPALGSHIAPYNSEEYTGTGLQQGDTVYLGGTAGIPAGFYTLLPARYALLPGAYLVSAVPGYADLQPGGQLSLADGTAIVAGYYSTGDTGIGGTAYRAFALGPGSAVRKLAQYNDSVASRFFNTTGAKHTADAGLLSINAAAQLAALGNVNAAAAPGGVGASVEVSANNLNVVGSGGAGTAGGVELRSDVISGWHAASVLLGGQRSADGLSIAVTADQVSISGGAKLTADEVIMVGRTAVNVSGDSSVSSNSATAATAPKATEPVAITLSGPGAEGAAFLAVSDLETLLPVRSAPAALAPLGQVNVASGGSVLTRGALSIDAPGGTQLDGTLGGAGASWSLGGSNVVVGASGPAGSVGLTPEVLAQLQSARALRLASTGALDFATALNLGSAATPLTSVTLAAADLNNSGGQSVNLFAKNIELHGVANSTALAGTAAGQGTLALAGDNIALTGNTLSVDGFARTSLQAAEQIVGRDSGTLNVNGALDLTAARLSAGSAANSAFRATGDVQLNTSTSTAKLPAPELGGALTIAGANITDNANLVAPSGNVTLSAAQTLSMGSGAVIDVAGTTVTAAGRTLTSGGGVVRLQSGTTLDVAAGSAINVSGAGNATAGRIAVNAGGNANLAGTLTGAAAPSARGGGFALTAGTLRDFSALNDKLQTGGFTDAQRIHVAQGDLQLAANGTTTAHKVAWVTDNGSIDVAGTINAPPGSDRATIDLYASNAVTLHTGGALKADGDAATGRGGLLTLGVGPAGSIALQSGGSVSARGSEAGSLRLRAPSVNGTDVAVTELGADVSHAGPVTIEAVLPAFTVGAAPAPADFDGYAAAAAAYTSAAAPNIQARLNPSNVVPLTVQPGIEVHSTGDLTLGSLDLSAWRFGGTPAALTVRAAGSVTVAGNVSDGFSDDGSRAPSSVDLLPGQSSTVRIVAGSNLSGADPLSLDAATASDLVLAPQSLVRTGTGNLDLVASRDVVIGAGASVYTGGLAAAPTIVSRGSTSFATGGGQLSIAAQRDVIGTPIVQSPTAWLTRLSSAIQPTVWGTDYSQFGWSAGTFGGGDLAVNAGRNVTNVSAAAADSAIVSGDKSSIAHYGGGSLQVQAGGDINGGMVYLARGVGQVSADGAVTTSSGWVDGSGNPLGLFAAMGDAKLSVAGRTGVAVGGVVNPTMLASPDRRTRPPFFFTYGSNSLLSLSSAAGNVSLSEDQNSVESFLGLTVGGGSPTGETVLPAGVEAAAYTGDLMIAGNGYLFPSDAGQLSLFAARDLVSTGGINISDAIALSVPGPFNPQLGSTYGQISNTAQSARHQSDLDPVLVTAGRDIIGLGLSTPKAVQIAAGRDISGLLVSAQNLRSGDITEVSAGRDLLFTRGSDGMSVGGPGEVLLLAGRDIDLGASAGVVTTGNLQNANLPTSQGAGVTALAGVGAGVRYADFVSKTVPKSTSGASALTSYFAKQLGKKDLTLAEAMSAFSSAAPDVQRAAALQTFFAELVASGREANTNPKVGFTNGYAAIDALFPGNRSASNPYLGNINMDFSRIYTLAGGNIEMLAPGGLVNVGVATPPASAGIKKPSELGIVTQKSGDIDIFTSGDVLVNQSRVFTLQGGNIAVWSTLGNIDAGRGAKSSISAPPPTVIVNANGDVSLDFAGAVAGSGIRTIATSADVPPGNVDLIAPVGFVNAGDAGIGSSGNINIAALRVIGADNIQFGGSATGVPAQTSGLAASLAGVSAVGGSASKASGSAVDDATSRANSSPLAQSALSWLEVFVLGLGDDACRPDDLDCLKRQKHL